MWESFKEVCILRREEEDPGTSVRRISAAEDIGGPLVRRTHHEQSPYLCDTQRVQALIPPDHCARVMSSQWLLANCKHTVCSNNLFTSEVGFTRDGTVSFHNTHVCVDGNPHITVASIHQHTFSTNFCVGILGDRLFRTSCLTYQSYRRSVSIFFVG
jgi:hypothetical protein